MSPHQGSKRTKDNTDAGTATVTVIGKDNFTGSNTVKFTIKKAANKLTVKAAKTAKATKKVRTAKPITKVAVRLKAKATYVKATIAKAKKLHAESIKQATGDDSRDPAEVLRRRINACQFTVFSRWRSTSSAKKPPCSMSSS